MFFVSATVKRSPRLSLSLSFLTLSHAPVHQSDFLIPSRKYDAVVAQWIPQESKVTARASTQSWGNARARCAHRCAPIVAPGNPETRFLATCQFSARGGALIASVVTMNGDRCTRDFGQGWTFRWKDIFGVLQDAGYWIRTAENLFLFFHLFERKIARLEEARDRYVWRLQGTTFSPLMLIIAYKYWILL